MPSVLTQYTVLLGLFELPTTALLLRGNTLNEVTPWFDNVPLFERHSYACMYISVLGVLVTSRFFSAYLPRQRLIQVHNAVVHAIELFLFLGLCYMKQSPLSLICYILLAVMVVNCVLFSWQALDVLTRRKTNYINGKKND